MAISLKTTSGKVLASAALLGTAAAVAGLGTYGAFTSSTNASQEVAAGTVDITLADGSTNLNVPVTGLLPGDRMERLVTLKNVGTEDLGGVSLTTSKGTTAASPLTDDVMDGLQLIIESCSQAWTGSTAPYTCGGITKTVLGTGPVIAQDKDLASLASTTAGSTDHLKVSTLLPVTAGNNFQGASSTINFAFTATQRGETVN